MTVFAVRELGSALLQRHQHGSMALDHPLRSLAHGLLLFRRARRDDLARRDHGPRAQHDAMKDLRGGSSHATILSLPAPYRQDLRHRPDTPDSALFQEHPQRRATLLPQALQVRRVEVRLAAQADRPTHQEDRVPICALPLRRHAARPRGCLPRAQDDLSSR